MIHLENEQLFHFAKEAMETAYVPYSKFRVGAVVVTKDGQLFTGCNIENASYGATNCAERTAIFKAVSQGYREFEKIMVIADSETPCAPCGICRQVVAEFFDPSAEIVMTNLKGEFLVKTVEEILPYAFGPKYLEK